MTVSSVLTIIGMVGGFFLWCATMLVAAGVIKQQFKSMKVDIEWIKGKLNNGILETLARHDERIQHVEKVCEID